MHPTHLRRRKLISAKSFTIAMVLVNVGGLVVVEHKMKQAQVPDAYALDDGAAPALARADAMPADHRALPEVAFAQPATVAPATGAAAAPSALPPLPVWKPAARAATAVAVLDPSPTAGQEAAKPHLAVARTFHSHTAKAHHGSFTAAFDSVPPTASLTTTSVPAPGAAAADEAVTVRLLPLTAMPSPESGAPATPSVAAPSTPEPGGALAAPQAPAPSAEMPATTAPSQPAEPAVSEAPAAA